MALWQVETGAAIVPTLHVHLRGTRLHSKPQMAGAHWRAKGGGNQLVDEHECQVVPKEKRWIQFLRWKRLSDIIFLHSSKPFQGHSLNALVFISISSSACRAILQSLVRSSDKNSDGAMDFEELTTFGDFNLAYNIWPRHLQMAMNARWGMGKWVKFCTSFF